MARKKYVKVKGTLEYFVYCKIRIKKNQNTGEYGLFYSL